MSFNVEQFELLIRTALQNNVSDLHLRPDERPYFRLKGELMPVKMNAYSQNEIIDICQYLIQDSQIKNTVEKINEYDGSFSYKEFCRLRFNVFRYQGKIGLIIRIITNKIPTVEELQLSPYINKIAEHGRGLILVTGSTGSGKSSTLAAMINHINLTRNDHILTLEDPIEFIHTQQKCRITQREIGVDSRDFKDALRSALRQDPDIILIGEMRDSETFNIALKAAETGHVVFASLHTTNVLSTIGRLISMFPAEEQQTIKTRLADSLYAIICQRLLPTLDESRLIPAQEIMVTNPGIRECIIGKNPMSQIMTFIEAGFETGKTQSFDQHLHRLYSQKVISLEVARAAATSPENFERNLIFTRE